MEAKAEFGRPPAFGQRILQFLKADYFELPMARQPQPARIEGALVINKPQGRTSHDVVDAVRHLAGFRQIGHLGTLDPRRRRRPLRRRRGAGSRPGSSPEARCGIAGPI